MGHITTTQRYAKLKKKGLDLLKNLTTLLSELMLRDRSSRRSCVSTFPGFLNEFAKKASKSPGSREVISALSTTTSQSSQSAPAIFTSVEIKG